MRAIKQLEQLEADKNERMGENGEDGDTEQEKTSRKKVERGGGTKRKMLC
jgi:hypothetical protein